MISSFNECPKRWAAAHFYGKKGNEDGFRFGTAFHEMMEKVDNVDPQNGLSILVDSYFDDEEERGMVHDSVMDLQEYDRLNEHVSMQRELHFEIPLEDAQGDIVLIGHIDQLIFVNDQTLMIRDFKTNRNIEPAVVWNNKIQPRIYNWAVRKLYPQVEKILFQVVYPRYAHRVTWEMQPEAQALPIYIKKIWLMMESYLKQGSASGDVIKLFPAALNAYCGWCPIRDECLTYQQISLLREVPSVDEEGPGARYYRLSLLKKAIEAHMSDAKRQVRARMSDGDYRYEEGGVLFQMSSQNRVSYDTESVWPDFLNWLITSGQGVEMSKILSFSTTGVAALLRDNPDLYAAFEAAKKVKKTEESLTVVRGK